MTEQKMSRDEQIGFHKGAVDTLTKERAEMLKIVNITNQLLEMHLEALKKMGVDLTQQVNTEPEKNQVSKKPTKKDDDFSEFY